MTAPRIVAILDGDQLRAPAPGYFRRAVAADHLVTTDDVIGELEVLGRVAQLVAPRVSGILKLDAADASRRAVSYGDVLFRVVAGGAITATSELPTETHAAIGLVFRAPTSGRFYGRPSPDKPAFVEPGTQLAPGTTICLLEVMKTFNRVTYAGAPARVREVLVAEGADVNAGDALLALDAG